MAMLSMLGRSRPIVVWMIVVAWIMYTAYMLWHYQLYFQTPLCGG